MRGSPQREMIFFIESFIDELARAAGIEPVAFRMAMLGGSPRLAACLQAAASAGGWDAGGRPPVGARLAGALGVVLWATVIVEGRLIPYSLTWFQQE